MSVYIEKVVSDYLRADEPVAAIVGRRVVSKTPGETAGPWVRVTRINAPSHPDYPVDYLIPYQVQLDCYASSTGGDPEANELARTVRAALIAMRGRISDDAVITGVRFTSDQRGRDTDLAPARERVVLAATIHAHP